MVNQKTNLETINKIICRCSPGSPSSPGSPGSTGSPDSSFTAEPVQTDPVCAEPVWLEPVCVKPAEPGWEIRFTWEDDWKNDVCRGFAISGLVAADPEYDETIDLDGDFNADRQNTYRKLSTMEVIAEDLKEKNKYANVKAPEDGAEYRSARIGKYSEGVPDPEFRIGLKMIDGEAVAVVPYDYVSIVPLAGKTEIDYLSRIRGQMFPGVVEKINYEFEASFESFMYGVRAFI